MNLENIIEEERQALMAEYAFPLSPGRVHAPPYCAIPHFDVLRNTPSALRARHPVRVEELPGKRPGQAFVQSCPSLNYKFLWTHVDNDNYREDYVTFLREHHGLKLQALPRNLHVDHLFNRARARFLQLNYIRMILLPDSINMQYGAGYEKSRTQGGFGREGRERGIDEVLLMKIWGVSCPRQGMPLTPPMLAHLHRMAITFGIPASELERNVRELMDVAAAR